MVIWGNTNIGSDLEGQTSPNFLKKKVSSSAKIERTRTHVFREGRKAAAAGPDFSHPLQFLKAFERLVNGSFPGDAKEISSAVDRGMCKKEIASHHSKDWCLLNHSLSVLTLFP